MYQDLSLAAGEAARRGGALLQAWRAKFTVQEKSPANLVTEADHASQAEIHQFLELRYPRSSYLGEEGLAHDEPGAEIRWIIDPLDGTSNYVHGFPYYCVSIGVEVRGQLVAGAVYDPTRDEMFQAAHGSGATLNGNRIGVSRNSDISQAMCMASLPIRAQRTHVAVEQFLRVLQAAQTVQRSGSAALNLCCVASGRIDGFYSISLCPWDMAAGVVIVREAGGRVTRTDGAEFQLAEANLLATNGTELHAALGRVLSYESPNG